MAIRSFKDREVETFFYKGRLPRKRAWMSIAKIVLRKLDMLHYAKELTDLRCPPSNHLESLERDLFGYYSIRINNQWRLVFKWDYCPYDVQIMDYH